MRLMIGVDEEPVLLVSVGQKFSEVFFEFICVNGAWSGTFDNGRITVRGCPLGDFTVVEKYTVLCRDQSRLTGDYNEVFNNFGDVNYVSPAFRETDDPEEDWIPF